MNADVRTDLTKSFVEELSGFQTQFDIFRLMKRVCEAFGFRSFMVMRLPEHGEMRTADYSVITNWPTELLTAYDEAGLLRSSPLIARLRRSTKPVVMSLSERSAAETASESAADGLFSSFGLTMLVAFAAHDASGQRGAVSFAGDRDRPTYGELLQLNMIGIHVFERLSQIAHSDTRVGSNLTERETDCLAWTAEGKTSGEIAAILGLSEHTVNHYLNRAAKKLATVNRTQAVAKALRRGWIK